MADNSQEEKQIEEIHKTNNNRNFFTRETSHKELKGQVLGGHLEPFVDFRPDKPHYFPSFWAKHETQHFTSFREYPGRRVHSKETRETEP